MKHTRLVGTGLWLLLAALGACVQAAPGNQQSGDFAANGCSDNDRDGYGSGCAKGLDCDDSDPATTTQCRAGCGLRPEQGCPCEEGAVTSCFLSDKPLPDDKVMCTEGTRVCRSGKWSGCESTQEYVVAKQSDQQAIIDPNGADPTCSKCDVLCFKAIDNLTSTGGVAGGTVTFGSGGGLTLLPGAGGGSTSDGGTSNSCVALAECCYGLIDPLLTQCKNTAAAGVTSACDNELAGYCEARVITGPTAGCVKGTGIDTDCDGIPNPVDSADGPPFADTNTQAIFHELMPGASATDALTIEYKINSADIYILFDTTGTMASARQNLSDLLTTTNVVHCAQLAQCCGTDSTCLATANAGNATNCYNAQPTYCTKHVDCADNNLDGLPDNDLATKGVLGGINCLIADARFGLGGFRELPLYNDSSEDTWCSSLEGCRYGDRDEVLFRHMVDITSSQSAIATGLSKITMNYNWDVPEGGNLALYSIATGKGHYFGINRPAVPDRTDHAGCPADTFGYPCFRNNAVPVVLMFTDAPQHNGPGSSAWPTPAKTCNGRGSGCPYANLTASNSYTSAASSDSASDRIARFVPATAENSATAYDLGDVKGKYLSMVGDTTYMKNDYLGSKITCSGTSATDAAPDVVIKFSLSGTSTTSVNFHLTKDNAYSDPPFSPSYYGDWSSLAPGPDEPTPATDFSTVLTVFSGTPEAASSAAGCTSDKQPTTLSGSNWHRNAVDLTLSLAAPKTYYVVIKGINPASAGHFQLQIGETSARLKTTYTPPTWTETSTALATSKVRVIPVLATGDYPDFVSTAEKQADALAQASGAVRSDGTSLWYPLATNAASKTGQAVVNSIAELSKNLAMDVTLTAIDGPDSSTAFQMNVTPVNTVNCTSPHPLVDTAGACSKTSPGIECNTQYDCRPGAVPKFQVTFTNPSASPVPLNTRTGSYGGYLFKLQLKQDHQYLLAEIPVFLIPNQVATVPPAYQAEGDYQQQVNAKSCKTAPGDTDAGTTVDLANSLPSWGDLYFDADVPDGTSIEFQMCTSDDEAALSSCDWSKRSPITVTGKGSCSSDTDCVDTSLGYGICATNGVCRYVTPAKVWPDVSCTMDSQCPNGPLGAGEYMIKSRCDTVTTSPTYKRCIAVSAPGDIGATLDSTEDGMLYSTVRVTLHSTEAQDTTPQLYDWFVTYSCHTAL